MYILDDKSKIPLHIQLYSEVKKDIILNYKTGEKLPSTRKMASLYNISKNTVKSAYSQLVVEGYIDSYPQSGYIVTDTINLNTEKNNLSSIIDTEKTEDYLYDFFPARLEKDSFPLKIWKRIFNKTIDDSLDFGAYSCGQGELGLRVEIAQYLNQYRAVKCQSSQVIICNGFSDSMGLLAKILKKDFNSFATEDPGYHLALKVFDDFGYKINKINIDNNGLDIDALEKSKAKIVYITPSHQFPTGVTMPVANRQKLIQWANEKNGFIIEDDYDSELRYTSRPIPSLQGLDNYDNVIFLGTFSKSLSPAIRVSYIVLPNQLLPLYQKHYDFHIPKVSLMTQKTLEFFMKDGHWERHLRKIRTLNRKKHNLMKQHLIEQIGDTIKIDSQGGGLAILINPIVNFNWDLLKQLAIVNKLKLHFAKKFSGDNWEAIQMGFGGLKESEIENAIKIFSTIWRKCIL